MSDSTDKPSPSDSGSTAIWPRVLRSVSTVSGPRLALGLVGLYLLAVLGLSLVGMHLERRREFRRLNATLEAAGFALDAMLGPGFHDRHTPESPIAPADYDAITRELNRLATMMDLEYVYSMVRVDGHVRFVVSNETREDLLRNTPSVFMSLYPDPPKELLQAFETNEARSFHFATYTNSWDSFYSVFIPRDTPSGRRYILAADIKLEDRRALLLRCLYRDAAVVLLLLVPLLPLILFQKSLLEARERIVREQRAHARQIEEMNASLEETVAARTSELRDALASLKGFSYSASHDLQAPLRAITGFAQALKEDSEDRLDPEGRQHLERILAASRRMADLIDRLLEFAALAHAEVAWEEIDLTSLARSVATELQQAGLGKRTEVVVGVGLRMVGDPQLLRLVLQNLVSNAFKYTREGDGSRIEIRGGTSAGTPWMEVRDNGIGFEMAHAHKLFRPFERLHGPGFEGHGIGLAQVARIVEKHGGTVAGSSAPGEGAVFRVEIPEPPRPES